MSRPGSLSGRAALNSTLKRRSDYLKQLSFFAWAFWEKKALWNALESAATGQGNLTHLITRAVEQHSALEDLRKELASRLLRGWDADAKYLNYEEMLCHWAKQHGLAMGQKLFTAGKAGEFDGVTLVMNSNYEAKERLFYAVHAIGSIVIWSRDRDAVQHLFDELHDAKKQKRTEVQRFVAAIERYRQFETESSEYAVWILKEIGAGTEIASYTNLMRADIEAMTQHHEVGEAPVWNEFFARWNSEVTGGKRQVEPFKAKYVEEFQAVKIETQEILQRQ